MKTEIEIRLLSIERDRLKEMIEELEDESNFVWGIDTCPVCKESKKIGDGIDRGDCSICWEFGVSNRCDYINDFWSDRRIHDEDGRIVFNLEETEYLQDLFANYIRQIDEKLEELK